MSNALLFYNPKCGPCNRLKGYILGQGARGENLWKRIQIVNTLTNPTAMRSYGVRFTPTLVVGQRKLKGKELYAWVDEQLGHTEFFSLTKPESGWGVGIGLGVLIGGAALYFFRS
jgi:hypothetical protein